jgi:hypothetical protein
VADLRDGGGLGVDLVGDLVLELGKAFGAGVSAGDFFGLETFLGLGLDPGVVHVHGAVIDGEVVAGDIAGEGDALAVVDGAAGGFDGKGAVDEGLHFLPPGFGLGELEVSEAQDQREEAEHEGCEEDHQPPIEHFRPIIGRTIAQSTLSVPGVVKQHEFAVGAGFAGAGSLAPPPAGFILVRMGGAPGLLGRCGPVGVGFDGRAVLRVLGATPPLAVHVPDIQGAEDGDAQCDDQEDDDGHDAPT